MCRRDVWVAGRNGAGKSTLMRILATLQEPDEGTVHLGELDLIREKERVCETLAAAAEKHGRAIGTAMYAVTLRVLAEELPELRARGFKLIRASEVVR